MALHDSTYIPLDPKLFTDGNELTNLKSYVLRQLGWPLIRVEITEEQLTDAILDAIQLYHEYAAMEYELRVIPVIGSVSQLPDDINSKFISEVIFERSYFDSISAAMGASDSMADLGGVMSLDQLSGGTSAVANFDIAQYYMYMQQLEDFKKTVGLQQTWRIFGREIHLYPAARTFSRIGIVYKPMMSEAEAEQSQWIKKYSVAGAMMIVGRIRSKLSGFSSTGATISADGEAMKSEARTELDKLELALQGMGMPMPIMQG